MAPPEQLTSDRHSAVPVPVHDPWAEEQQPLAERAARAALKAQVGKLERELAGIVSRRFPHIPAGADSYRVSVGSAAPSIAYRSMGPHLPTLAELERMRDRLARRVYETQKQTVRRDELEWRARELLERMRAEPARYKFTRLPVVDLGERGCGVWEVRPRLGLIGMLAGWWQLKLSSGCPLPRGPRKCAAPVHSGGPDPAAPPPLQLGLTHRANAIASDLRRAGVSIVASVRRWRSVIDPTVLVSDIGTIARNLRQRLSPQRRWLISRSATAMLCASQGHSRMTSATASSPVAILRLSSARARRTLLARSRARMY
jgi:hypothetical protein